MTSGEQGRADLHMHTTVSDGLMTPRQLLDDVARRGHLDIVAITDHDRIDGSLWAYARRERYPFDIVPGVEVSSAEGHILALWVTEPIPAGLSMTETAAAIHEGGGIAILAHPFFTQMGCIRIASRIYRRNPEYLLQTGIDGLEGYNAAVVFPGTNFAAQRVARFLGLPVTGGSDAHTLGAVGSGWTAFRGKSAADLRAGILNAETVAQGRPWPAREYRKFIADFISRRGKIVLDEFEIPELDEELENPAAAYETR